MQRWALTLLFALLAGAFAAVAGDALSDPHGARRILVGGAAVVVAVWFGTLCAQIARRARR